MSLSSMSNSFLLMAELGMTMVAMLMMKPMIKGIASVKVKSAFNLSAMKIVVENAPPTVMSPVYLNKEMATSAISSDNMKGTEYLFLNRNDSTT